MLESANHGKHGRVALIQAGSRENFMHLTMAHISPLAALVAGILILLVPRILNYVIALFLILQGLIGLNAIHHFIR
jgi:Protein of unknown function (DUF3096)